MGIGQYLSKNEPMLTFLFMYSFHFSFVFVCLLPCLCCFVCLFLFSFVFCLLVCLFTYFPKCPNRVLSLSNDRTRLNEYEVHQIKKKKGKEGAEQGKQDGGEGGKKEDLLLVVLLLLRLSLTCARCMVATATGFGGGGVLLPLYLTCLCGAVARATGLGFCVCGAVARATGLGSCVCSSVAMATGLGSGSVGFGMSLLSTRASTIVGSRNTYNQPTASQPPFCSRHRQGVLTGCAHVHLLVSL